MKPLVNPFELLSESDHELAEEIDAMMRKWQNKGAGAHERKVLIVEIIKRCGGKKCDS